MKKDIQSPRVENIAVAAVPEEGDLPGSEIWYIYLVNLKEEALSNVLISSRGYGQIQDESVKTSELRHFLEELPGHSYAKIEPIMQELFALSNQYWVSFYIGKDLYDKKYIFLAETIQHTNLTEIPLMGKKGVLLI